MIDYVDKSNTPMFCFAKNHVCRTTTKLLFFFIYLYILCAPEILLIFAWCGQTGAMRGKQDYKTNVGLVEIKEGALFEILTDEYITFDLTESGSCKNLSLVTR